MRFGEAISHLLADLGVDTVFGIPGVHTLELYRGIRAAGIDPVTPRHEQGAGFMADGYARVSGRPGVCYLVSGPGVLNAMTPIAQAWHDSVPMLVISSAPPRAGRGPWQLHAIPDQVATTAQLTSMSAEITDPDDFVDRISTAFASWTSGRPRPVHLTVPTDVLALDTGRLAPRSLTLPRPAAAAEAIGTTADALEAVQRPVIICGGGGVDAAEEVRQLAEQVGAVVLTTGNARGLLHHAHPLNADSLLPLPAVMEYVRKADLVLAIGTKFSDTDLIYTEESWAFDGTVVRVDIDPSQIGSRVGWDEIGIVGDAAQVCGTLVSELARRQHVAAEWAVDAVAAFKAQAALVREASGFGPWLDALEDAVPEDAIVAVDSTQPAYVAHHLLARSRPRRWLAPYGLGTLGPALPMAIGAGVAEPNAPTIAIAGDGGSLFTLTELATVADRRRQLGLIIWDNRGYGEIRDSFTRADIAPVGVDTTAHDFEAIAFGFGLDATTVADPEQLAGSLRASLANGRPKVIVVRPDQHQTN